MIEPGEWYYLYKTLCHDLARCSPHGLRITFGLFLRKETLEGLQAYELMHLSLAFGIIVPWATFWCIINEVCPLVVVELVKSNGANMTSLSSILLFNFLKRFLRPYQQGFIFWSQAIAKVPWRMTLPWCLETAIAAATTTTIYMNTTAIPCFYSHSLQLFYGKLYKFYTQLQMIKGFYHACSI